MAVSPIRLKAMYDAVSDGDEKKVRLLLKAGVDAAGCSETGHAFIARAVVCLHMHIVKLLEAEGADMATPGMLCSAIEPRGSAPDRELALYILNATELPQEEISDGLVSAAGLGDLELAQELIDRGADVNVFWNATLVFPLWSAVVAGDTDMVRLLLANGADPKRYKVCDYDEEGNVVAHGTLVDLAEAKGHPELAEFLKTL